MAWNRRWSSSCTISDSTPSSEMNKSRCARSTSHAGLAQRASSRRSRQSADIPAASRKTPWPNGPPRRSTASRTRRAHTRRSASDARHGNGMPSTHRAMRQRVARTTSSSGPGNAVHAGRGRERVIRKLVQDPPIRRAGRVDRGVGLSFESLCKIRAKRGKRRDNRLPERHVAAWAASQADSRELLELQAAGSAGQVRRERGHGKDARGLPGADQQLPELVRPESAPPPGAKPGTQALCAQHRLAGGPLHARNG